MYWKNNWIHMIQEFIFFTQNAINNCHLFHLMIKLCRENKWWFIVYFFYLRVIMPGTNKKKKYLNIDIRFKIEFFLKNASFTIEIEMSDLKWMRKVNKWTKERWLIVMFKHFTDRLVWRCKVLFDPDFVVY